MAAAASPHPGAPPPRTVRTQEQFAKTGLREYWKRLNTFSHRENTTAFTWIRIVQSRVTEEHNHASQGAERLGRHDWKMIMRNNLSLEDLLYSFIELGESCTPWLSTSCWPRLFKKKLLSLFERHTGDCATTPCKIPPSAHGRQVAERQVRLTTTLRTRREIATQVFQLRQAWTHHSQLALLGQEDRQLHQREQERERERTRASFSPSAFTTGARAYATQHECTSDQSNSRHSSSVGAYGFRCGRTARLGSCTSGDPGAGGFRL